MAQAFRSFDIRNKGQITKSDFIFGVENLKINLSSNDIDMIFSYLDASNDGALTY
jgi:Ca2+-binding EF-hand superfamily protein